MKRIIHIEGYIITIERKEKPPKLSTPALLDHIASLVGQEFGVNVKALRSSRRHANLVKARRVFISECLQAGLFKQNIADYLNRSITTIYNSQY